MKIFNLLLFSFLFVCLASCNSDKKTEKLAAPTAETVPNVVNKTIVDPTPIPEPSTDMNEYVPPATPLPEEIAARISAQEKKKNNDPILRKKTNTSTANQSIDKGKKEVKPQKNSIPTKKPVTTVPKSTPKKSPNKVASKKASTKKASNTKAIIKQGKLRFNQESFQFGVLTEGDEIKRTFKFTNVGNAPIAIENVLVSCGCTTPEFPFTDIAPGEDNELTVYYSSKNKWGHQKATLNIITNGNPKEYLVFLEGDVHERTDENKSIKDSLK